MANTLTIVFIAEGIEASGGEIDVDRATTTLLIGAVVWAYLGIIFEFITETVAWERWEGTIEYTFMAPLSRAMHLGGSGVFAVLYGLVRAILLFIVVAAFFGLQFDDANFVAALVILVVASVSFFGIGMMTAVLPLISPEKGAQLGFVAQGMLLVVSGVYYPVDVLPQWMQWLATISPATYALEGIRAAILDGAGVTELWSDIWPLLIIGAACIPLGSGSSTAGGVREAARQAQAVRMIDIRTAENASSTHTSPSGTRSPRTSPRTPPSNANGATATGGGCISSPSAAARSSAAGSGPSQSEGRGFLSPRVILARGAPGSAPHCSTSSPPI